MVAPALDVLAMAEMMHRLGARLSAMTGAAHGAEETVIVDLIADPVPPIEPATKIKIEGVEIAIEPRMRLRLYGDSETSSSIA